MPRKLKTYQTSQGFYDLAIAAPSMKAALAAWGAGSNLFHQGFAEESDDGDVVEAAMAKPGVVLQRPVGSNQPFREHSDLPTIQSLESPDKGKSPRKEKPRKAAKAGEKDNSKAALAFERERQRREKQRQKEEAAAAEAHARREEAKLKAEAALDAAKEEHEKILAEIVEDRAAVDRREEAEAARWDIVRDRLQTPLRKAGQ